MQQILAEDVELFLFHFEWYAGKGSGPQIPLKESLYGKDEGGAS
jgi:hypothetical protein